MPTRPFDFAGASGQTLSGRLDLPEGPARGYALFAHCFTCTKNALAAVRIARALTARGFGVLRFDFTGLGESEGDFADSTFSGDVRDLVAGARHMAAQGLAPQLLIGHSLGGAAVLAAAGDIAEAKAVAVIGAPFEVQHVTHLLKGGVDEILAQGEARVDIGGRPFTLRRTFVEDLRRHDQGQRIAGLKRSLLVLHAPRDAIVGIDNATAIFQAARHPKSFVSLDDADHLLTRAADAEYAGEVIAAWASRYVAPAATAATSVPEGHVVVEATGVGRFQVTITAGAHRLLGDEPEAAGGLGSGLSPYELLSAGLGACTAMTLRLYADQKKWPLQGTRVEVAHCKRKGESPADLFTRAIALEGALDAAQRARLLEIADRCPLHRTLESGARVRTSAATEAGEPGQHASDMAVACADGGS